MKKQDYKPAGEITHKEIKISREKAIKNLEVAKKIEKENILKGKRYIRVDKRTLLLK
jgi:hypothetical protein